MTVEPYFYRRCLICGHEIRTPWGPEVHSESHEAMRGHVLSHSQAELADYALGKALSYALLTASAGSVRDV